MTTLADLAGHRVGVWGLGREGWATLRALRQRAPAAEVSVIESRTITDQERERILELVPDARILDATPTIGEVGDIDILIKSPGISLYRDDLREIEANGVAVTSATRLWFAEVADDPVIAVTGTLGKSTTTSLIHHLLRSKGITSRLGGNIGTPLIDLLLQDEPADIWTIEVSSFQIADLTEVPTIGVVLNLLQDHMDWHRSVERYHADKMNLLGDGAQCTAVLNYNDPIIRQYAKRYTNKVFFGDERGFHVAGNCVMDGEVAVVDAASLPLRGKHNLTNLCAALTAVRAYDLEIDDCATALSDFTTLNHRLQLIGERAGVQFINDSIATSPAATIAALDTFRPAPISLLLGGFDRGHDYRPLAEFLNAHPVHTIIGLPASGPRILDEIRKVAAESGKPSAGNIVLSENLDDAVRIAVEQTPAGGIVLLSPGAPSQGAFANFEERGRAFAQAAGFS